MRNAILIIDEDRLFCDVFSRLARGSGFRITAICPDATVAIARATGDAVPDIVLADMSAADPDGILRLRAHLPDVRVALLGEIQEADARTLFRTVGPDAMLSKSMAMEALLAVLALLSLDMMVLPHRLIDVLPQPERGRTTPGPSQADAAQGLTGRETDILRLLAEGDGNRVIADRLGITESTVKMHCKSLLRKLGVPNRTQAALLANRWGLAADATRRSVDTSRRR